ncbi:MAG: GrdX family protein [Treponemataceae bacterium]
MNEKSKIIITNNPKVQESFVGKKELELIFVEERKKVFTKARDLIHQNWQLINHTMMANIPLHMHPYRSLALKKGTELDMQSLSLIEGAIERLGRGKLPKYNQRNLDDFQELDLVLFNEVKI